MREESLIFSSEEQNMFSLVCLLFLSLFQGALYIAVVCLFFRGTVDKYSLLNPAEAICCVCLF